MIKFIVQLVITSIEYFVLQKILKDIHSEKNIDLEETDTEFTIKIPWAVPYLFCMIGLLGVFMFFFFFLFKFLLHNESVTNGHLWLFSSMALIGFIIASYTHRWKISVKDEEIEIKRPLHKNKKIEINEIDKAVVQKKNTRQMIVARIVLYKNGRKLIAVEDSMQNYIYLYNLLKRYHKIDEELEKN